jgi:hypothetical protein
MIFLLIVAILGIVLFSGISINLTSNNNNQAQAQEQQQEIGQMSNFKNCISSKTIRDYCCSDKIKKKN